MKPNSNGKYVFKPLTFKSLFLPSLQEITELLGLSAYNNGIKLLPLLKYHIEAECNCKLETISRSSRAKLTNNGVGRKTIEKLCRWISYLPISFKKLFNLPILFKAYRAMSVGSTAGTWYFASYGFRLSNNDSELITLFGFIEKRAKADYEMLKAIKKQFKSGLIKKNDLSAIWQAQLDTWEKHSLVPSEQLNFFSHFLKELDDPIFQQEEARNKLRETICHLSFDFYFSAIAHFEVGISLYYMRHGVKGESAHDISLFSSVIKTLTDPDSDKKYTCFSAMLNELRNILKRHNLDCSWRALATYIDIKESGKLEEKLKDKQYKQLKDWCNGKNMPSDEKLRQFVSNLASAVKGSDDYGVDLLLIYLQIANGIDTLVKRFYKDMNDKSILLVLDNYQSYFKYYKEKLTA